MKTQFFFLLSFVSIALFASSVTVSNKVVFVDQDNNINAPELIASVADMTTNKTEIALAAATANAAKNAARESTNLVAVTVDKIVENEFVVYRYGETDSLGVLVALPESTKVHVGKYTPNVATDGNGKTQHELTYYTTEDAGAVTPAIKYSNTLEGGRDVFKILDTSIEWGSITGSFTDASGTVYPYGYTVKFWTDASSQGFFIVYLDADAASGDGMTFDIVGGITGGLTQNVTVGTDTLVFKGGLLMEVKSE